MNKNAMTKSTPHKKDWKSLLLQAWRTTNESHVWAHCASVGFFGFLSIFPVMAVFVLIYGLAFSPAEMQEQISLLRQFIPPTVYDVLNSRLSDLVSSANSRLTFGLLFSSALALYSGSRGIKYLIILINLAFNITRERSFLQGLFRALGLTFLGLVVIIVALSSIGLIPLLTSYFPFPQIGETIALWSRWPILAIVVFGSFLGLYRFAPNHEPAPIKRLIPGAILATILWILLSILFSIYVQNFNNYSAEFGALSAAVVIMLWLYYSAFIVALGATFNYQMVEASKAVAIKVYS